MNLGNVERLDILEYTVDHLEFVIIYGAIHEGVLRNKTESNKLPLNLIVVQLIMAPTH